MNSNTKLHILVVVLAIAFIVGTCAKSAHAEEQITCATNAKHIQYAVNDYNAIAERFNASTITEEKQILSAEADNLKEILQFLMSWRKSNCKEA